MSRQPIRLSSGRTVWPNPDWTPGMGFDARGNADNAPLRHSEMAEYRDLVSQGQDREAHELAAAAASHPQFADARDVILQYGRPGAAQAANNNPHAFNEAFSEALERLGPSEAETDAWLRREEKFEELVEKAEKQGLSSNYDIAELLQIASQKKEDGEL